MNELLPCPFCGGEASLSESKKYKDSMRYHYIECIDCAASSDISPTPINKRSTISILEAALLWNTRTPIDDPKE